MSPTQEQLELFCGLLESVSSANNQVRKGAEEQLVALPVSTRVQLLLHVLTSQAQPQVKNIACYILKMCFERNKMDPISEQSLEMAKKCLPQLVMNEQDATYRKRLVSVLAGLIELHFIDETNTWEDSIAFVGNCIRSSELWVHEIALNIITYFPAVFGDRLQQVFLEIVQFLNQCLQVQSNPAHQLLTLETLTMFCEVCDRKSLKVVGKLVPAILAVIQTLVPDSSLGSECMTHFICLCDYSPRVFRGYSEKVFQVILGLMTSPDLDNAVYANCLEALVSYTERAASLVKKHCSQYIPLLFEHAFRMLTMMEDDEVADWFNQVDSYEEDDNLNENAYTGETSLDRLACALKDKSVMSLVLNKVSAYLQKTDWKYQDAAIVSIGAVAEGCHIHMKPLLPQIVQTLCPFFGSNNPKVVFSLINTFGQLFTDFPGYFHNSFHNQVFPHIFKVAEGHNYIKVKAQAIYAFVNIIDGCNEKMLHVYDKNMVNIIANILASVASHMDVPGVTLLLRAATNAIIHLFEKMNENSDHFVPLLVPHLVIVLQKVGALRDFQQIMPQLLDALVALAVSCSSSTRESFLPAIVKHVELFNQVIQQSEEKEDLQLQYYTMLTKLADIASHLLGPVVPTLVPTLLNFLAKDISDNNFNADRTIEATDSLSYDYQDDSFSDKALACDLVSSLASNLKGEFAPYVEIVLQVLLPLFATSRGHDLMTSIAGSFPELLGSYIAAGQAANALLIWNNNIKRIFMLIIKNIESEDLYAEILQSFADCVVKVGNESLNLPEMKCIGELFDNRLKQLLSYDDRVMNKKSTNTTNTNNVQGMPNNPSGKDNDDDDANYDDEDNDDDMYIDGDTHQLYLNEVVLQSIQSFVHDLFGVFKETFVNTLHPMYKTVTVCMEDKRNEMFLQFAFSIFNDIVEFAPQAAATCLNDFVPKMLARLNSSDPDMRQITSFGFGLIAQARISSAVNYLSQTLPILARCIQHSDSNAPENVVATANCIAAYGRYIRYMPELFSDINQEIKNWLKLLPVTTDEVDFILRYLCELIETDFSKVLISNDDQHNLHIIQAMVAMILECENQAVSNHAVSIIVKLQSIVPAQIERTISQMSPTQKSNFDRIVKNSTQSS